MEIPMTPHDVLEKYFGFREFLDAQEEVITAIAGGADALVVMPTGGGKSLCYQLPALLLEGTTVVVSPLIALMKDQVDALQRRGISATLINSTLSPGEQQERIRAPESETADHACGQRGPEIRPVERAHPRAQDRHRLLLDPETRRSGRRDAEAGEHLEHSLPRRNER